MASPFPYFPVNCECHLKENPKETNGNSDDGNNDRWSVKAGEKLKKTGERGLRFIEKNWQEKKQDISMKKTKQR